MLNVHHNKIFAFTSRDRNGTYEARGSEPLCFNATVLLELRGP